MFIVCGPHPAVSSTTPTEYERYRNNGIQNKFIKASVQSDCGNPLQVGELWRSNAKGSERVMDGVFDFQQKWHDGPGTGLLPS